MLLMDIKLTVEMRILNQILECKTGKLFLVFFTADIGRPDSVRPIDFSLMIDAIGIQYTTRQHPFQA